MAVLELEAIRRSYEGTPEALRGVSSSIEPGEVLGLLGRSGAGKTTLLRVAAGLLKRGQGTVAVLGLDPLQLPDVAISRLSLEEKFVAFVGADS